MAEKSKAAKAENVARIEALRTNGTRTPSGIIYEFLKKTDKNLNSSKIDKKIESLRYLFFKK